MSSLRSSARGSLWTRILGLNYSEETRRTSQMWTQWSASWGKVRLLHKLEVSISNMCWIDLYLQRCTLWLFFHNAHQLCLYIYNVYIFTWAYICVYIFICIDIFLFCTEYFKFYSSTDNGGRAKWEFLWMVQHLFLQCIWQWKTFTYSYSYCKNKI